MNFHPYSEIFPMIDDTEFDLLTEDIKAHGLREKIWTYEGQVLDGRNRFLACHAAKVEPQFREYHGKDALAFVLSLNMQRRHLTESQRAMVAAKIANMPQGARNDLRPIGTKSDIRPIGRTSQAEAAEQLKVGERSLRRAKKVIEKGSKALQKAVESGELAVSKAASVVDLPKSQQLAAAKAKPEPEPDIDKWEPEENQAAQLEQAEKDYAESIDKVMGADDKLAAAHEEIKRQAAEIATLKLSRNQYQNQCSELIKKVKSLQRALDKRPAA